MALNTFKYNHLMPLCFMTKLNCKGLIQQTAVKLQLYMQRMNHKLSDYYCISVDSN